MIFKTTDDGERIISFFNKAKIESEKFTKQLEKDKIFLTEYFNATGDVAKQQVILNKSTKEASKSAIEYAVGTKGAAGSVSNFEQQQIKANASIQKSKKYFDLSTVSATAYKLAIKGITIVANMATSALLSGVVYAFSKLFTAQNEAIEKAKELTSTYKSNNTSLEDYKEQINTLVTELNTSNISYEDSKTKRKELMSIQDELFKKYGTEEEVIKSITAAINGEVDALDTLSQKSYYEWLASVDSLTGAQKFGNGFFKIFTGIPDQYKSALDSAVDYMEDKTQFFYVKTTGNEELDKLIQEKFGLYKNAFDEFVIKDMVPEEAYELLGQIRTAYRDNASEYLGTETDNILTTVNDSIQSAMTTIDAELGKHQETYHTYLEGMIKYDSEYSDEYADLLSKRALLEEAELSTNDEGKQQRVLEAKKAFYDSLNNAITSAENNDNVKRYFENLYPDLYSEISSWNFEYSISANTDGIADAAKEIGEKYSATDLLNMVNTEGVQEGEESFNSLIDKAIEYGVCTDKSAEEVQKLIDLLVELGIVQDNVKGDTFNDKNPILSLPDAQKLVNGLKDGETEALGLIDELSLLQEILSDTGNIQQETYAKLLSCSSKYSVAIRTENGRITLNTTKLKQVAKARQLDAEETIRQTLALRKQEWLQWANNIDNYNGTLLESITSKYNDIDALQNEITQYELLANSVNEASNAFENFKTAQSTNDQDMYDTAQEAFNILKEYTSDTESKNYGKYNTDEFQEAVMLLMDTDTYRKAVNAKDLEEYQKVISSFVKTLNPLFDEKNYNSAASLFDRIQEIMDSGDIPEADKDWAKRLGISEETFHALSQLGNLYDFNVKEIFEGYQLNTLDNYYEKLQAVKSAKDALNAIEDQDTNAYIRQEAELKNLTESYDTFVNDTVQKVSDAYTAFQQSSTGKSFADYLKETLDFDDTDITGSLMTVIDKSGDLQKTLDSISLNEVVQSQQEEYQQLQNLNQIISTLNENGYSSVDVEVKNKSGFDEVYNEYEKLRQKALEYQEAISNSDNPHEINELNGYLSECVSNMEKLREPLRLEIEANIERVNAQLESVKSKINELNNQTSLSPYQQERLGVLKGEQAALENQQATLEARLKVIVDESEVKDWKAPDDKKMTVTTQIDDSAVTSWTAPEKTMKVRAVVDTSGLTGSLGGLQSGSGTPGTSNTGGASQGGSHAKGTVGNAFANGYNGLPTDEKNALRSEYGQKEMTVYPDGRYEITETPTLSDLPKGTVIFNEKQTNRILKGISHFKGTVGRAFNTGTKINLPNLVDVISNNNAISGANNNSSKPSTTSDSPSHAAREAKEATEEIFDWIERRIKKFQAAFDKWIKQAETAVTSGFINKYYKKATSAIKNELSTYGKAYKRYMKQADSVGLSKKYRDKVKNGTIDIETIKDEKLAEQIKKYQEWCVTYAPLSGNRWRYSI